MIGYIAAAKSFETNNTELIHSFSYQQIKKHIPEKNFTNLTTKTEKSKLRSQDPKALAELLPFYQIRPVYTGMIYIFEYSTSNTYYIKPMCCFFDNYTLSIVIKVFTKRVNMDCIHFT